MIQYSVKILATGDCLPEKVLTNDDLAKTVDTNDEWITQRTGIKQRYIAAESDTCSGLGAKALNQALSKADLKASDLDFIFLATMTPDMCCPSSAAVLADQIGAKPAGAVDISAACSGFVYGLNMAWGMIQSGFYKRIAVVGAEILSRIVNWEDRGTCILFGDGAGAVILEASEEPVTEQTESLPGCLFQNMGSNGGKWDELYCPRRDLDIAGISPSAPYTGVMDTLHMNGREVYKFAVSTLKKEIDKALKSQNIQADDLAAIIPHQSNARIIESAQERLGLSDDKMIVNIQNYGNTSAASVPIAFHETMEKGSFKAGDLVLFVALGGGLTWASSLWRL